ncbi:MAG: tripartite tricarboxylate transporter TctB family protein [Usitatibacter sp.]
MKIGHPKNFWGGVLFAVIGLLFTVIAKGIPGIEFLPGYAMGTPARMGPAFFPFWLGLMLLALGLIIAINGVREKGGPDSAFPQFHWRPILLVLGAVVMFGLILKPVGMLIAGLLLVIVASVGSKEFNLKKSIILGSILVVFCAFVFVGGLKLPIPLCPDIESLQSAVGFCRG